MNSLRKILFPFSLIYGAITGLRNWAYDSGILTSTSFDLPIIAVGNLNVGGTGKSPMIEYLIRLLNPSLNLAVLSRGYGRKTKGYFQVTSESLAENVGDEPLQFARKFKDIIVSVCEDRQSGIAMLLQIDPPLETIILDDAYTKSLTQAKMSELRLMNLGLLSAFELDGDVPYMPEIL